MLKFDLIGTLPERVIAVSIVIIEMDRFDPFMITVQKGILGF